jgi:uncharacterized membrane protein YbaN (DUF454 family)
MMKWLKQQWRAFRASRPGHRFRELYERRERTPHARLKKTLFFVGGLAAIAAGIATYPVPLIPSEPFMLFGIAAIAQASWYGARALDWLELKLRVPLRPLARLWRKLPRAAKIGLTILWSALIAFVSFMVYRLVAD